MEKTMQNCSRYSGCCGDSDCGLQIADCRLQISAPIAAIRCGLKLPRKDEMHAKMDFKDRMVSLMLDHRGSAWIYGGSSIGAVVPRPTSLVPEIRMVSTPLDHREKSLEFGNKLNQGCRPSSHVPRPCKLIIPEQLSIH